MAFRARCPRMHKVMGVMTGAYGLYRAHSGYHRRIDECRALVGRQLTGMAAVMDNLAGEMRIRLGPVGISSAWCARRCGRRAGSSGRSRHTGWLRALDGGAAGIKLRWAKNVPYGHRAASVQNSGPTYAA